MFNFLEVRMRRFARWREYFSTFLVPPVCSSQRLVTSNVVGLVVRILTKAISAGFDAFEKMKCIFSIAPMESLEKSSECFSLKNTHWTL